MIKITTRDLRTRPDQTFETGWEIGVKKAKTPVPHPELCSSDVFHAFPTANVAALRAVYSIPWNGYRWFETEGEVAIADHEKVGCFSMTLIKEVPAPWWYHNKDSESLVREALSMHFGRRIIEDEVFNEQWHLYKTNYPAFREQIKQVARAAANKLNNRQVYSALFNAAEYKYYYPETAGRELPIQEAWDLVDAAVDYAKEQYEHQN